MVVNGGGSNVTTIGTVTVAQKLIKKKVCITFVSIFWRELFRNPGYFVIFAIAFSRRGKKLTLCT